MTYKISIPDVADSVSLFSIDNNVYEMRLTYNTRTESWYMSLLTSSGLFVIKGIKVLQQVPLIRRNNFLMPIDSNLYVLPSVSNAGKITRDNFGLGKSYELYHFKDSEVVEI